MDSYRVQQRVIQLARHHFRDTAVLLERVMRHGEPRPLIIGGHQESIRELFALLPPVVREASAGSFAADPHSLTPARARDLAASAITTWADQKARHQTLGEALADLDLLDYCLARAGSPGASAGYAAVVAWLAGSSSAATVKSSTVAPASCSATIDAR